jgi:hypothetical protein
MPCSWRKDRRHAPGIPARLRPNREGVTPVKIRSKIIITTGAALAVAISGGAIAIAASAVTSTLTYHGCVIGTSRTLEHVYTSKTPTCPSGSFAANWNQTGPRGPQESRDHPGLPRQARPG